MEKPLLKVVTNIGGKNFKQIVSLLRLVDGRLRAHRPNASFSACAFRSFVQGVFAVYVHAETKRLVDGRAGAHRPNALEFGSYS